MRISLFTVLFQGQYTFEELPFLVIGGLTLIAAIIVFFLPEMNGIILPDSVEEIEKLNDRELGRSNSGFESKETVSSVA